MAENASDGTLHRNKHRLLPPNLHFRFSGWFGSYSFCFWERNQRTSRRVSLVLPQHQRSQLEPVRTAFGTQQRRRTQRKGNVVSGSLLLDERA